MVIITGSTACICLEENLKRFFDTLEWREDHKCLFKGKKRKRRVDLHITEDGLILQKDPETQIDMILCKVLEYYAVCSTCGKKVRSNHDYED